MGVGGWGEKDVLQRKIIQSLGKYIYLSFGCFFVSFDYEDAGYQTAELVKMDILLNGNLVEELVTIVHK